MTKFNKELIQETLDCFKEENFLEISEETACEYLESMAGLYLAFHVQTDVPINQTLPRT